MTDQARPNKKIMIIGLPNTGKSQVFINLTGEYTVVSNAPLTTIALKRAPLKLGEEIYEVIDTPGLLGFYVHSEEEILVREAIFDETPEVIIQCIDANRLKQSLVLTIELMLTRIPLVISLNAVDETTRKGIWIDSAGLSRLLGIPVVESIAVAGHGLAELKMAILRAKPGKIEALRYGDVIDQSLSTVTGMLPSHVPYHFLVAFLVLMRDPLITGYLQKTWAEPDLTGISRVVDHLAGQFRGSLNRIIDSRRNRWIDEIAAQVVKRQKVTTTPINETIARLSRHPVWGLAILAAVLSIIFFLVVNVGNRSADWLTATLWTPIESSMARVLPGGFWHDFLIGDYGFLSMGVATAVLTVVPILTVFLLLFSALEDTGYIPNLAVLTKRLLGKLGLGGEALIPMVLGFGCKTMATLTARTIPSKRERFIVIYLVAFAIPCASQLGLSMGILGHMGWSAFVIVFVVLAGSEIIAGVLLNRILKKNEEGLAFIHELPPIRLPNPKWVLTKTYFRLYWFLRESLLIFVLAALGLFTLDKIGVLEASKKLLSPLVEGWLGLPVTMVDALILCLARKEVAVGLIINLVRKGQLDYVQCIVAVILTTMAFPCFANITAMARELGPRNAAIMTAAIFVTAFIATGVLNQILVTLV